ncbi:MAG: phosphate signaling complex protein PhoU [Caldilineaceae bacterium]|nr:phosphate signaling complex protein PhoU [Caldilineaceae bacterium]
MPRTTYLREMQHLQDELVLLASMVSHALTQSMIALKRHDRDLSEWLIRHDKDINAKRYQIERDCLTLIATQQPMARDLRFLAGVLEIAGELERIGDYAKGIGRIVLRMPPGTLARPIVEIPKMCEKVLDMLRRAQDAYLRLDVAAAYAIPKEDDEVDELYNRFNREMLEWVRVDPASVDVANLLMWAAHNIERAGDRVTNICERTIYTATGDLVEVDMNSQSSQPPKATGSTGNR